jgi:hypothetical protein
MLTSVEPALGRGYRFVVVCVALASVLAATYAAANFSGWYAFLTVPVLIAVGMNRSGTGVFLARQEVEIRICYLKVRGIDFTRIDALTLETVPYIIVNPPLRLVFAFQGGKEVLLPEISFRLWFAGDGKARVVAEALELADRIGVALTGTDR